MSNRILRAPIQSIVDRIVEKFSPTQVYLFRSQVYGQPTDESDVDILAVMQTDESPLHAAARISESVEHTVPLDIIVRTPDEFASQLAGRNLFESRIQQNGISLYEAAD